MSFHLLNLKKMKTKVIFHHLTLRIFMIANYVNDKCHNVTSTSWTRELIFMATNNRNECILQFIVVTQ